MSGDKFYAIVGGAGVAGTGAARVLGKRGVGGLGC